MESRDKMSCEGLTGIWQLCHLMKNRTFDRLALSATSEMLIYSRLTTGCRLRGMRLDKDASLLFICWFQCLLLTAVGGKDLGLIPALWFLDSFLSLQSTNFRNSFISTCTNSA